MNEIKLPEKSFQVLGQLSTTGITRVHSNENTNGWIELDLFTHEDKSLLLIPNRILNALHLYGDDRQYLDGDTIELVEAAPSARLR